MSDDNSNIELSRRKALMGLGGIGIAGAAGGYGTQALFSDTESTSGTFTAGELDLQLGYEVEHYGNSVDGTNPVSPQDQDGSLAIELNDIKPGDSGLIRFSILNNDNPAWVWFRGRLSNSQENGQGDAELDAEGQDTDGYGELDENLEFRSFYDQDQGGTVGDGPQTGSIWNDRYIQKPLDLKEQQNQGQYGSTPVLLDGVRDASSPDTSPSSAYPNGEPVDPFANGATQYVTVRWALPTSVGNEVQGDAITVNFDFYAEQSRHNPEERFRGTDAGPTPDGETNVNTTNPGSTAANDGYPQNPWASQYQSQVFDPASESPSTSGLVLGPEPDNGQPNSST
ncbi:SipW-dependent-type signal peptide-containing protein [Halorubrum sp. Atlit-26R]|uniref:SipW-dependent-type signal peptide-containing protein n=1 Tax=Halorubrum sp. Atlit-26R TaxID=2282128 RepID=UPI000EF17978|nr:SipW-dependent-type signal peptide-containing protein [Halorubrum sp. Atlit-26R]RLM75981.1 hypothetical protein DVK07_03800 [Halorubrum sp. Atlit-26R]